MYLAEDHFYDHFHAEEYNDFKFWREPIMEISLEELEIPEAKKKDEVVVSIEFDSFLYWRDPIPELDEL